MFSFLSILFRNGGIHPGKGPKLILFLFLKLLLAPLTWLEDLVYGGKIRRHKIVHAPVFIIGHWRSGTTLLHQILSKDPDKAYLNFYQSTYPGIFLLTEKIFKPFLQKIVRALELKIPYFNNIPFDWDFPCEEDTALLNMDSAASAYWAYVFPGSALKWFSETMFFEKPDSQAAVRWKKDYLFLIKKLSYHNKGKQLILKSPPNTGRIWQILELFPDAKFIYLRRDPVEVYYSHMKLWKENNRNFALQVIPERETETVILDTLKNVASAYNRDRQLIPEKNIYELDYRSLKENTPEELKNIYKYLEIKNHDQAEPVFREFISGQNYRPFQYILDPEKCAEIRKAV